MNHVYDDYLEKIKNIVIYKQEFIIKKSTEQVKYKMR